MRGDITEQAAIVGSAKDSGGWMTIDTATVASAPDHAPLDQRLTFDFASKAACAATLCPSN